MPNSIYRFSQFRVEAIIRNFLGAVASFVWLGLALALGSARLSAQAIPPALRIESRESSAADRVAAPSPITSGAYRLAPSDLIVVSVYQEPDLETKARIAEDGNIVLPLIGSVKVSGGSVKQAVESITALYKKDYLVNPVVTLTVLEQTKGKIIVMGAVNKPGSVEIAAEGGIPILEAIGLAGGYSRVASPSKISVKRRSGGSETVIKVNGKEQATGEGKKTFFVYSGDVITVGESIF